MDPIQDYLRRIDFRAIKPNAWAPQHFAATLALHAARKLGLDLEALNTRLPEPESERLAALRALCRIPKASTLANGAVINRAVSLMPSDQAFVNVGVWHGFSFLAGMLHNDDKRCIGVDSFCVREKRDSSGRRKLRGLRRMIHTQGDDWTRLAFYERFEARRSPRHEFYEMDYADYFEHVHRGPIGFYIYDAQHRYRDQLRGLRLAEPYFAPGCLVLIDDTNAHDNHRATMDFMAQSEHRYELLFDRRTRGNRHPTFWNGLLVFRRMG